MKINWKHTSLKSTSRKYIFEMFLVEKVKFLDEKEVLVPQDYKNGTFYLCLFNGHF